MTQEPTETPDISNYLSSEEQNRKLIFTLHRELVNAEWNNISHVGNQMLEEVEERNKPQVMIDLSQLEHMGSSMVALLVRIWKRAEAKGGAVSFSQPMKESIRFSNWRDSPKSGPFVTTRKKLSINWAVLQNKREETSPHFWYSLL